MAYSWPRQQFTCQKMAAGTPCLVQAQLQPVHRRQLALALRLLCAVNRAGLFTCHHHRHRHRHPNIVLEAPSMHEGQSATILVLCCLSLLIVADDD
eukprot:COSAG05_NODE_1151_length_5713_cov_19.933915_8_plen_96_part_00